MDEIDRVILTKLGENSRKSSFEITNYLRDLGYAITDRTVRHRIRRLEDSHLILGYTLILNPSILSDKVNRTILLKFKYSTHTKTLVSRLQGYCEELQFCVFSVRLTGDFDWICHFVFDSVDQNEIETNNFLNRFVELISDFRSYESNMIKTSPFTTIDDHESREQKWRVYNILNSMKKYEKLNSKLQFIVESLVKHFNATFARVWSLDKERKNLVLKFSDGKYKSLNGEFSRIPAKANKIGQIVLTGKPVITNDVVNDSRIKYPQWAKEEKIQSFAGYPLKYKNKVVGVLAMFSRKKLQALEFETLGIFF